MFFVVWTDHSRRTGRVINIDSLGRLVSIVACAVPVQSFEEAEIIIPRTGAASERTRPRFRQSMPSWCLRARHQVLVSIYAGPRRAQAVDECVVCEAARALHCGVLQPDLVLGGRWGALTSEHIFSLWLCQSCGLTFHYGCAGVIDELWEHMFEDEEPVPVDAAPFRCALCAAPD